MEKDKIIEHVLNEWAMRSPDGLASGYDTAENIQALNEVLSEKGIEIDENIFGESKRPKNAGPDYEYLFKKTDPNNKDKVLYLISVGHPNQKKYPDLQRYDGDHTLPADLYRVANDTNINNALAASEKDEKLKALRNIKKVSLGNVRKIKEIFATYENKALVQKYKDLYDKIPTIEEAIKIYEGEKYPEL